MEIRELAGKYKSDCQPFTLLHNRTCLPIAILLVFFVKIASARYIQEPFRHRGAKGSWKQSLVKLSPRCS